jgi:ATP-dependent Lhr-like helicase
LGRGGLPTPLPNGPSPIVTQQAMVATLERSQWAWHELVPLLCGALPESDQDGIAGVIDHMVALGFLMDMDGVLQIGPMTEQQFGRAHYKDLLASFTGVQLLLGRFGNIEVAYIDPTILTGDEAGRLILLFGKSWRITDVDWNRLVAWLEPVKEGGKARWTGSGRTLSREIDQGILRTCTRVLVRTRSSSLNACQ